MPTQEQRDAYAALHAAVERVVRLDHTEAGGDVTVETTPETLMVMQYVVVAACTSPELVEAEATHYYRVMRDDRGQTLPWHHSRGLFQAGLDGIT